MGATDIHIDPGTQVSKIRFRVDGSLTTVKQCDPPESQRLVNQFRVLSNIEPLEKDFADGRWAGTLEDRSVEVRTTFIATVRGDKLAIRMMGQSGTHYELENLGFIDEQLTDVRDWLFGRAGMFVVAGPTGSGKTTLLYALAKQLDRPEESGGTREDPGVCILPLSRTAPKARREKASQSNSRGIRTWFWLPNRNERLGNPRSRGNSAYQHGCRRHQGRI